MKLKKECRYIILRELEIIIDLGNESEFSHVQSNRYERLRITNYNPDIMSKHHCENKNEYAIATDIINADVIINLPKPKTHRFAGVTISMKNMVGINTNKEWLPHHSIGSIAEGGDAYIKPNCLKRLLEKLTDQKNRCIGAKKYTKATLLTYLQYSAILSLKLTSVTNKIEWDNKDISEIKREIKPFILTSGWQKINE